MEEKKITEKESLELISQMIKTSQNRLSKSAAIPFLVMGYTTVVTTLLVWFALYFTNNNPNSNLLWLLIVVVGVTMAIIMSKRNPSTVKTYFDTIIDYIWIVIGIVAVFFNISFSCIPMGNHIQFLMLLLMGIGTTLSGLILKFKPLTICGFIAIFTSPLYYLLLTGTHQLLFFGLSFALMMIIPGHILFCKAKKLR